MVLATTRLIEGVGRVGGHVVAIGFDAVGVVDSKLGIVRRLYQSVDNAVDDADRADADLALLEEQFGESWGVMASAVFVRESVSIPTEENLILTNLL